LRAPLILTHSHQPVPVDRRPLGTPPVRSKINPTFASTSLASPAPRSVGSTDGETLLAMLDSSVFFLLTLVYRVLFADFSLKPHNPESMTDDSSPVGSQEAEAATEDVPENRTVQQATTPPPDADSSTVMETPKRYQFVREPSTDSRLEIAHSDSDHPMSPATEELARRFPVREVDGRSPPACPCAAIPEDRLATSTKPGCSSVRRE